MEGTGLKRNRLGVLGTAFFVLAAVAPMAAIVGGSPVVFATVGPGTPAVFILAALLFAVFSVGYVTMNRHLTHAGGFVAYVARALGPRAGAAVAGVTVLCYAALLCGLLSQYGIVVELLFSGRFGLDAGAGVWLLLGVPICAAAGWATATVKRSLDFASDLSSAAP